MEHSLQTKKPRRIRFERPSSEGEPSLSDKTNLEIDDRQRCPSYKNLLRYVYREGSEERFIASLRTLGYGKSWSKSGLWYSKLQLRYREWQECLFLVRQRWMENNNFRTRELVTFPRIPLEKRKTRMIGSNPNCYHCLNHLESIIHALRDCPKAASIWLKIINPAAAAVFSLDTQS
ncbi:hypothetical protein PIB30_045535 [Stylosanthes scabra]|uniref:Reverse transcriptase zinc-binding domain-containing protein n=1 Tax=Stylosanthes scabra TaxID=79078 RepID=A0ABU6TFZ0_9FABA|nr:hypothetical protein [Stylosanthes scabra]